jgi:hypothetical protein
MRATLLALSAVALSVLSLSPIPEAYARGASSARYATMDRAEAGPRRAPRSGKSAAQRRGPPARVASAKVPGGCGTYMYWKNGRCNDARNKK